MSTLRSAIDQLASVDLSSLSDAALDEELVEQARAVRTVTPAQRKALAVRDRSCRFPGCDRPPTWCDAHHIKHWLDQGRTDLDNLILLCRRHHTLVHEHGFRISGTATDANFLRPDGTALGRDGPG